jgi:hypothetical protein
MTDMQTVLDQLDSMAAKADAWRAAKATEIEEMKTALEDMQKRANRPNMGGAAVGEIKHLTAADGRKLPLLASHQKAGDLYRDDKTEFNLGDFCRDAVVGSRKAASGAALVPLGVGSQIIDSVRARTVLIAAGSGTIVVDGPTNLARLTTDPTVYQHTEAANDIVESDIVAEPVTLNPKLLAVLVPLTVELVQDSPNLDQLLTTALSGAFAAKLDALGIATLLADVDIPESQAGQDPAVWLKVLEAVGSALALDQALPSAHISSPADFIARASQLASTAGSWLGKPPALASMLELQTTGLSAGTALMGVFSDAFAVAMRSELRVEVVRHAKPTTASHLLVAHMRADGVVLQPGKLYRQLKTV